MTPSSARVAIALALRLARLSATGVRHGLAMSLITALLAALTACGQPPVDDVASSTASAVVVSPNDERAYDLITLSNGIEVILVSDSTAEKSAAAFTAPSVLSPWVKALTPPPVVRTLALVLALP